MKTPAIIKKETIHNKPFGMNSRGNYTPYWIQVNGKERFIANLIERTCFAPKKDKQNRKEFAEKLINLRANKYKFLKFYCGMADNPKDFLNKVIKNGYTLERHGEFFSEHKDMGFTDFHGNLTQISCAFSFRIFDTKLLKEVQKLFESTKTNIHY